MSPEQQIFTRIRMICVELFGEEDVYEYLPGDADYPFVVIGEQFVQPYRTNKDKLNKQSQVTVHIHHNNPYQRGTVSKMVEQIEEAIKKEFGIDGEMINLRFTSQKIGNQDFMHATIEPNIEY